jgi:alanine racemase
VGTSRREFLSRSAAAGTVLGLGIPEALEGTRPDAMQPTKRTHVALTDRFDPWVEVYPGALEHNVGVVSTLTNGRPILAVIKNNAYGLGLVDAARLLARHSAVVGFAVVKPEDAIALRDSGLERDVLLMGMAPDDAVADLVAANVQLSLYLDDDAERLPTRAGSGRTVTGHAYLDTGMSRMGIPYHRAGPWFERIASGGRITINGAFTAFAEEPDFDRQQLDRFRSTMDRARGAGVRFGVLHAASSNGVYHLADAHLDMVRPGIALFGGYPSRADEEQGIARLEPAFALKCRVVRVEQLREGDGVSYGRNYVADHPTWIATLPAGHVEGYPRTAVDGARVSIGDSSYPVIGAVSASHVIVEVGREPTVAVGDVATLIGPGHPDVHPNEIARATGSSVYDLFMHLNPALPRVEVD